MPTFLGFLAEDGISGNRTLTLMRASPIIIETRYTEATHFSIDMLVVAYSLMAGSKAAREIMRRRGELSRIFAIRSFVTKD